jgi:hypothetical protein
MIKHTFLLTLILLFVFLTAHADDGIVNKSILKDGVSLGSVIAAVISWDRNKSIFFCNHSRIIELDLCDLYCFLYKRVNYKNQ